MHILENTLKRFINVPENLVELTNQHIIEVDEHKLVNTSTNIVIGKVLTKEKHPDADKLSVTTVDVGNEVLDIVCGAPNVAAGQYVIVAKVGAVLPGNFEIKSAKVRGIVSNGMICSLKELGLDEEIIPEAYQHGIYVFEKEMPLGVNPLPYLGLDGIKMTLGLTPNRSDLLSYVGFAFDLAAVLNQKIMLPKYEFKPVNKKNPISVKIETNKCFIYHGAMLDVKVKESPLWLKSFLIEHEVRPINNVVDITNYVMLVYGTPLHAFDYKKVNSNEIVIKEAKESTKVVTLDEIERNAESGDILITNGKEAIALGGVMGLANTIIDDSTTQIILEAANFDKNQISKTSKRLGLRSESSLRFERGVDTTRVEHGMNEAIQLLIELADGKLYQGIAKDQKPQLGNLSIETSVEKLNRKLGTKLEEKELLSYFERLNYEIKKNNDKVVLTAPSYRNDISIEADLVEEIARIYGINKIPNEKRTFDSIGLLTPYQKNIRRLRHLLANLGFNEVINYSLVKRTDLDLTMSLGNRVEVLMPMSEDRKTLRQSLISGLLNNASYHMRRQMEDLAFFEIGKVFAENIEINHLALLLTGKWIDTLYDKKDFESNFFVLKGVLENIASAFKLNISVEQSNYIPVLHPGIQGDIIINGEIKGFIGKIHPKYETIYDIKDVYVLELSIDPETLKNVSTQYEPVSKFPSVERDLSFIVSREIPIQKILTLIQQTGKKLITNVKLFDIYQKPGEDTHSLAVSIEFNDKEKTLEKETVEKVLKSIKNRLSFEFKAIIRD